MNSPESEIRSTVMRSQSYSCGVNCTLREEPRSVVADGSGFPSLIDSEHFSNKPALALVLK
jgi:hypothetical protein